ncbi:hypothetical protein ACFW5X_24190 [Streptomyces albogriseolus]
MSDQPSRLELLRFARRVVVQQATACVHCRPDTALGLLDNP